MAKNENLGLFRAEQVTLQERFSAILREIRAQHANEVDLSDEMRQVWHLQAIDQLRQEVETDTFKQEAAKTRGRIDRIEGFFSTHGNLRIS